MFGDLKIVLPHCCHSYPEKQQ